MTLLITSLLVLLNVLAHAHAQGTCYLTNCADKMPAMLPKTCSVKCKNITASAFQTFMINNADRFSGSNSQTKIDWTISASTIPRVDNATFALNNSDSVVQMTFNNNLFRVIAKDAFVGFRHLKSLTVFQTEIPTVDFLGGLGKLEELTLSYNNISGLSADAFANLSSLTSLDLSYNNLTTIGNRSLNQLPRLKRLYLHHNNISVIQPKAFSNNLHLQLLRLSFNKLRLLSNETLAPLTDLYQLYLNDNLLSYLEDGAFRNLHQLWHLLISNNLLLAISSKTFTGLNELRTLRLENNLIQTISPESFLGTTKLTFIDLRVNNISRLENLTFDGLKSLSRLNLTHTKLQDIQPGAFTGLNELLYLDLRHNNVQDLQGDVFYGLKTLQYLYLQNNNISLIKSNAFRGLDNLKTLNISNTHISKFSRDTFQGMPSLTDLEMGDLDIEEVNPGVFSGLSSLNKLIFGKSSAVELTNNTFEGLSELKTLVIKNTNVTTVHGDGFKGLDGLQHLILENSTIGCLNYGAFSGLTTVSLIRSFCNEEKKAKFDVGQWFDFGNLSMVSIAPSTLTDLFDKTKYPKFNNLFLNHNKLAVLLKDTFSDIDNMVELALDNNGLQFIEPGAFNELSFHEDHWHIATVIKNKQLIDSHLYNSLYLNNNQLTVLQNHTFTDLKNLVFLRLEHNSLEDIEPNAFGNLYFNTGGFHIDNQFSTVNTLSLNNNKLKRIRRNTLGQIKNLVTLRLDNNDIETIEPGAFHNFSFHSTACIDAKATQNNFNNLWLNHNKLTKLLNGTFDGLRFIVTLCLNHNNISSIEPGAFNGLSFTINQCFFNRRLLIKNKPDYTLYLNNNNLITLLNNTFVGLHNLTNLNLNHNNIIIIHPAAFSSLTKLANLQLNHNHLNTLPSEAFVDLNQLETLDLSYNEISAINSQSFIGLSNLKQLLIYNNRLAELSLGTLKHCSLLENLQLGNNNLSGFKTGIFSKVDSLKYLNISRNNFATLNVSVLYPLNKLEVLDLDDNVFSYIDYPTLVMHLPTLKFISVNNNNWSCQTLINMIKVFKAKRINYLFNASLRYSEENVDGISCLEFTVEDSNESLSDEDRSESYKNWTKTMSETLGELKTYHDLNLNTTSNMIFLLNNVSQKIDGFVSLQKPAESLDNWTKNFTELLKILRIKTDGNFNETGDVLKSNLKIDRVEGLNPLVAMVIVLLCISCVTICVVLVVNSCNIHFRKPQRDYSRLHPSVSQIELIDTTA